MNPNKKAGIFNIIIEKGRINVIVEKDYPHSITIRAVSHLCIVYVISSLKQNSDVHFPTYNSYHPG